MIADAGYWRTVQIQSITHRGIEVLIPPDGTMREGKRPGWENGLYERIRQSLSTERGSSRSNERSASSRSTARSNTTAGSKSPWGITPGWKPRTAPGL